MKNKNPKEEIFDIIPDWAKGSVLETRVSDAINGPHPPDIKPVRTFLVGLFNSPEAMRQQRMPKYSEDKLRIALKPKHVVTAQDDDADRSKPYRKGSAIRAGLYGKKLTPRDGQAASDVFGSSKM